MRAGLLALREMNRLLRELLQADNMLFQYDTAAMTQTLDETLREMAVLQWSATHVGRPRLGTVGEAAWTDTA